MARVWGHFGRGVRGFLGFNNILFMELVGSYMGVNL